jgi:hypothetical protein
MPNIFLITDEAQNEDIHYDKGYDLSEREASDVQQTTDLHLISSELNKRIVKVKVLVHAFYNCTIYDFCHVFGLDVHLLMIKILNWHN